MTRLGGSDPVIVAAPEPGPELRETCGHPVHPLLGSNAGAGRGLQDRLAVLVHTHEELHTVSPKPPIAGNTVGSHLLQRMAEMGITIRIINGGCEVEFGHPDSSKTWL